MENLFGILQTCEMWPYIVRPFEIRPFEIFVLTVHFRRTVFQKLPSSTVAYSFGIPPCQLPSNVWRIETV